MKERERREEKGERKRMKINQVLCPHPLSVSVYRLINTSQIARHVNFECKCTGWEGGRKDECTSRQQYNTHVPRSTKKIAPFFVMPCAKQGVSCLFPKSKSNVQIEWTRSSLIIKLINTSSLSIPLSQFRGRDSRGSHSCLGLMKQSGAEQSGTQNRIVECRKQKNNGRIRTLEALVGVA